MTAQPPDPDMLRYFEGLAAQSEWSPDWPLLRQRAAWEEQCRKAAARRPPGLMVEDLEAGGLHARVYRPPGEDPKPGVLYAHGGGWILGSCDTHDDIAAELAQRADAVVVTFDYRLAPEHPHPAQVEDALAVLDWMRSSGRAIGIDPTHIIGAGDSAGGQVIAGMALALKARGMRQLRGMVLIYPALGTDTETASYRAHAQDPLLTRNEMMDCIGALMGPKSSPNWHDPLAAPNLASDLSGLPACYIAVAAHDPLHDDGTIFHAKLKAAGIAAVLREEPALGHSYMRARHASRAAMAGFDAIAEAIRHLAHEGSLPD